MRRLLLGAVVVAALGGVQAGTAHAYCDPKYAPLCLNDCYLRNPLGPCPR
jgi:hypothetical protein